MNKAYFQYYETFEVILDKIKDDEKRETLRRKIIDYGLYGTEPGELDEVCDMAWTLIKELIDQQRHRRDTNQQNATGKRKPEPVKKTEPKFKKPTVEEIAAYCKEKGYAIDAEHFRSYYEANGWRVGHNPMKSWEATCANWASREKANGGTIWQKESANADKYADMF